MHYVKKTIHAGDLILVRKYKSPRYGKRNNTRSSNLNETNEVQKKINERNRQEQIVAEILENFNKGDWWVTLTFSREERPSSTDDACKIFGRFIQKIKRKLKSKRMIFRMGKEIDPKVIGVVEMPPSGAVHIHFLISGDVPADLIFDNWTYGKVKAIQRIYDLNNLKLANYLVKGEGATHKVTEHKFYKTRNLKKPKVEREIIKAEKWLKNPKPIRGYRVVEDSVINYTDDIGFDAQKYILIKTVTREVMRQ